MSSESLGISQRSCSILFPSNVTTLENIVNDCITTYIKDKKVIDTLIRVTKKKYCTEEEDFIIEIQIHFKSALDKTIAALDYKHTDKTKIYEINDRIKNIEYTKAEILSLDSRGILKNTFQIVNAI